MCRSIITVLGGIKWCGVYLNIAPQKMVGLKMKGHLAVNSLRFYTELAMKGMFFNRRFSTLIELPLLNTMTEAFKAKAIKNPLERTAVIYVHHALKTSLPVLDALFKLSLLPQHTFVTGKRYSDNSDVIQKTKSYNLYYQPSSEQSGLGAFKQSFTRDINLMWAEAVKQLDPAKVDNVLILDHGGYAANFVPASILEKFHVIGLEKTSGGLKAFDFGPSFPLINVANCAAKKILESPLIAEAVLAKLKPVIDMTNTPTECGVIGYGAIGKAIAEKLLSLGHRVIVYDNDPVQLKKASLSKNLVSTNDLASLVNFSKFIFGCSGCDVTESMDAFRLAPEQKTLISCSSEDREFLTLLQYVQKAYNGKARMMANNFSDVAYTNAFGKTIRILRAGFPANFDHSGESVPANDIQLTRALVLAGVFQAIHFFNKPHFTENAEIYALDAGLQQFVVREWLKHQNKDRFSYETVRHFNDQHWIRENSQGAQEPLDFSLMDDYTSQPEVTLNLIR